MIPVASLHGLAVTTVEGIGNMRTKLHPVQDRIAKAHGSQCGFCTPGIVMSMYTLLRNKPKPSVKDFDTTFQGNLCRCTGYRPIIEGFRTFTEEWEQAQRAKLTNGNSCAMGDQCCKNQKLTNAEQDALYDQNDFIPYDSSQEPIFPPELKVNTEYDRQVLTFNGKTVRWLRPNSLEHLLDIKQNYPDAKLVVGNTEVGVEVKFRRIIYPVLVQPTNVPEMTTITETKTGLRVGASVTLANLEEALLVQMKTKAKHSTRIFASIVDMLYYFAGKQIRNMAAIGGNIMTSSPISDLNPIFTAANCVLEVCSKQNGYRKIVMNEEFFTGYRRNKVEKNEILVAIHIPFTTEHQYFYAYKQAKRRDDDIAIVNAAVNVSFQPNTMIIASINVAYGGMAPTTVMAKNTQKILIGRQWNEKTLELAYQELVNDLPLDASAPGGNIHYRRSLTLSLFFRAYLAISQQLQLSGSSVEIPNSYLSGITGFHSKVPESSQYYQVAPDTQEKTDYVGRPIAHVSAFKQSCGEALYLDDIPSLDGELYLALVLSTEAHADIISIDAQEALSMDGVHAFYSAKDIDSARNMVGPIFHDEEVFVAKTVQSKGQVIGAIVADSQQIAQMATTKVRIEYKKLSPVIITIEDAIKHKSYFQVRKNPVVIKRGDVNGAFQNAKHVIEGECRTGGQEHFYLETHCALAIPREDEMEIITSTQHPSEVNVSNYNNLA